MHKLKTHPVHRAVNGERQQTHRWTWLWLKHPLYKQTKQIKWFLCIQCCCVCVFFSPHIDIVLLAREKVSRVGYLSFNCTVLCFVPSIVFFFLLHSSVITFFELVYRDYFFYFLWALFCITKYSFCLRLLSSNGNDGNQFFSSRCTETLLIYCISILIRCLFSRHACRVCDWMNFSLLFHRFCHSRNGKKYSARLSHA